jgi:phosphoglycolate phosphatase
MTLVDSRPGIHAALVAFRAETGVPIDADEVITRLGPPIQVELAPFVSAEDLPDMLARFRVHMARVGVMRVSPLPGAADSLAAVHAAGLTQLVVTGKHQPLAEATMRHAGLAADIVVGDLWAEGKGVALLEHGARIYVGDHPGDVRAARAGDAYALAVASGGVSAAELQAAGADHVLTDLRDFPDWFAGVFHS